MNSKQARDFTFYVAHKARQSKSLTDYANQHKSFKGNKSVNSREN
jgi:hypothetical protein